MKKSIILTAIINLLIVNSGFSQLFVEPQILIPADLSEMANFGTKTATDGNTLLVSAIFDQTVGEEPAGAVYVYSIEGENFTLQQKLLPHAPSIGYGDHYGQALAIQGDWAVVGAEYDNEFTANAEHSHGGAAYIYHFNGNQWEEVSYFAPDDVAQYYRFGCAVDICGDFMAISAKDPVGNGDGVYMYQFNGTEWEFFTKIVPDDYTGLVRFGEAIDLENNLLIVGDSESYDNKGNAWLYEFDGTSWNLVADIPAPLTKDYNFFGYAVAIKNNDILIGEYYDTAGEGAAYTYTYENNELTLNQELTIENSVQAGVDVFFIDKYAVVLWFDTSGGSTQSMMRFYEKINEEWIFVEDLEHTTDNDNRPFNIAETESFIFCGSPNYNIYQGAVNVFKKNPQTPLIQATDLQYTIQNSSEIELTWQNGSGEARAVFMAENDAEEISLTDNLFYTADNTFGNGEQVGLTGWYCVASGDISETTISGLNAETQYKVMVCEYNQNLDLIKYQDAPAVQNPITVLASTDITDFNDAGFSVYPNPASNAITIQVSENEKIKSIEMTDLSGKTIMQENIYSQKTNIDLSTLPKGVYFINVKSTTNTYNQNIILQ